jgi:hypothetical protein
MQEPLSASTPGCMQRPPHPWRSGRLLAMLLAFPGAAQYVPSTPQFPIPQSNPAPTHSNESVGDDDPQMFHKRMKAFKEDRHKSIVKDTQKLLDMARELNHQIQSTNPDSLTPAQLRRWSEIEKLAHHVKENMSAALQPNPPSAAPPAPGIR